MVSYTCRSSIYASRCFLTKNEKIGLLREYHQDLKKEVQGIEEKIKELEVNRFKSLLISLFFSSNVVTHVRYYHRHFNQ